MIFYFSATGNSQYVALRIAEATGERTVSITECLRNGTYRFSLTRGEMLGFVTPVYLTSLPAAVLAFLEHLDLETAGDHYIWHVVTYGRKIGMVSEQLAQVLQEKGLALQASFSVKILTAFTPLFDVSDEAKVTLQVASAESEITDIISQIACEDEDRALAVLDHKAKKRINRMQAAYDKIRKTKPFYVKDECIGCGICADLCPDEAIRIEAGKPVWVKDHCSLCLGCLHHCPGFAIQYGKRTEKHGQYVHPDVCDRHRVPPTASTAFISPDA